MPADRRLKLTELNRVPFCGNSSANGPFRPQESRLRSRERGFANYNSWIHLPVSNAPRVISDWPLAPPRVQFLTPGAALVTRLSTQAHDSSPVVSGCPTRCRVLREVDEQRMATRDNLILPQKTPNHSSASPAPGPPRPPAFVDRPWGAGAASDKASRSGEVRGGSLRVRSGPSRFRFSQSQSSPACANRQSVLLVWCGDFRRGPRDSDPAQRLARAWMTTSTAGLSGRSCPAPRGIEASATRKTWQRLRCLLNRNLCLGGPRKCHCERIGNEFAPRLTNRGGLRWPQHRWGV